MSDFDRKLKAAADAWVEKEAGQLADSPSPSPELDARVKALLAREKGKETIEMKKGKTGKRWTALLAAAVVLVVMSMAIAAAPFVRSFLNSRILTEDGVERLTEVPEGWIGVWTAEDLDAVRFGLGENYILMEDIEFYPEDFEDGGRFAGGWIPIGTKRDPFFGIFNGNGHTVRGLCVTNRIFSPGDPARSCVGLFGYCELDLFRPNYNYPPDTDPADVIPRDIVTDIRGYIKNLGIEDARIEAEYTAEDHSHVLSVGCAAGYSAFIVGCYADRAEIDVTVGADMFAYDENDPLWQYGSDFLSDKVDAYLGVGGVAGSSYMADACWSGADISVTADCPIDGGPSYAGGVVGRTSSCTSSYFCGTISAPGDIDRGVCFIPEDDVPWVLTYPILSEIMDRLNALSGEEVRVRERETLDTWGTENPEYLEYRFTKPSEHFFAYYCECIFARDIGQDLFTSDAAGESFYLLDLSAKPREFKSLRNQIREAFPDGSFAEFCRENGLKYGCFETHDLRADPLPDFEGFGSPVWKTGGNGLPVLSVFG